MGPHLGLKVTEDATMPQLGHSLSIMSMACAYMCKLELLNELLVRLRLPAVSKLAQCSAAQAGC